MKNEEWKNENRPQNILAMKTLSADL